VAAVSATFRVTDPGAIRREADRGIGDVAGRVADDLRQRTPVRTGTLQAGWQVGPGDIDGQRTVTNAVPYARFVEFGTVNMAAEPMIGPVLAEARMP
jgi:HK97 gp10 family phage protein